MSAVGAGSLRDHLGEVVPEPVVRHAALDRHAEARHLGEAHRVVGRRPDGLREIEADLARVDIEGRRELDVADVVVAQARAHEAGHEAVLGGAPVVFDPLDERGRAVADTDDGHTNRSHGFLLS